MLIFYLVKQNLSRKTNKKKVKKFLWLKLEERREKIKKTFRTDLNFWTDFPVEK